MSNKSIDSGNNQLAPITIVLGTRAQLIKMAPVIRAIMKRGLMMTLIFTNQHQDTVDELFAEFDLPQPEHSLGTVGGEKRSILRMLLWWTNITTALLLRHRKYVPFRRGILLTHGDTASTLWGALLGRIRGSAMMHVEAGLRSFRWFDPFPEELIRRLTSRLATIHACPNAWAVGNLAGYSGVKLDTGSNTLYDAIVASLDGSREAQFNVKRPYVVVNAHRFENVYQKRNLEAILQAVEAAAAQRTTVFVLHPVMQARLRHWGFESRLREQPNIILSQRLSFHAFIRLCMDSDCVLTDGGSNQEELSYLGIPTLVMRRGSERIEGLNENVLISGFDLQVVQSFLNHCHRYRREPKTLDYSPSEILVDWLEQHGYGR